MEKKVRRNEQTGKFRRQKYKEESVERLVMEKEQTDKFTRQKGQGRKSMKGQ